MEVPIESTGVGGKDGMVERKYIKHGEGTIELFCVGDQTEKSYGSISGRSGLWKSFVCRKRPGHSQWLKV